MLKYRLIFTISMATALAVASFARETELWFVGPKGVLQKTVGADSGNLHKRGYLALKQNGREIFFTGKETYNRWAGIDGDVEKILDAWTPYSHSVAACLASPAVIEGVSATSPVNLRQLCKKPDFFLTAVSQYTVKKALGRIEIDLPIRMTYAGRPENRAVTEQTFNQLTTCITSFYASSGLKLNLQFIPLSDKTTKATNVKLWDRFGRDDAYNWSVFDQPNLDVSCGILIHEVGHLLGLPDRYAAPASCPDRAEKPLGPGDIMDYDWKLGRTGRRLYRKDIEKIIAPLCGLKR